MTVLLLGIFGHKEQTKAAVPQGAKWVNQAGTVGGTTWGELESYLEGTKYTSYTIILKENIAATSMITVRAPVTIKTDGGNHSITRGGEYRDYLIKVPSGHGLRLLGNGGNLYLYGGSYNGVRAEKSLIHVSGDFQMNEGVYLANNSNYGTNTKNAWGGGVFISDTGTMTMYGGSIYNCFATTFGGGVYCDGVLNLYGGTVGLDETGEVKGNWTRGGGGGIYCGGICTLTGTWISGNWAEYSGGGYYGAGGSSLTMDGGEIANNRVTGAPTMIIAGNDQFVANGGGISLYGEGVLNGGIICSNEAKAEFMGNAEDTANGRGGGIYVSLGGQLLGKRVNIIGNKALRGGGICITRHITRENGNEAILNGTFIENNTAITGNGAGIACGGQLTVNGVTISNNQGQGCLITTEIGEVTWLNSASWGNTGGGVVLYDNGTFDMKSGEISRNGGYGVAVNRGAQLKMSGSAFVTEDNSIFLGEGKCILVTGKLQMDLTGQVCFGTNDGRLGRVVAKPTYTSEAEEILSKFRLEKEEAGPGTFLLRPGKDLTPLKREEFAIESRDLIISTVYWVIYEENVSPQELLAKIPRQQKYWGASVMLTCPLPAVKETAGEFEGWNENQDGKGKFRREGEEYGEERDYILYGIYESEQSGEITGPFPPEEIQRLTVVYDGCGGVTSAGEGRKTVEISWNQSVFALIENPFGRVLENEYFMGVYLEQRQIYNNSSFFGWTPNADGKSGKTIVYPGGSAITLKQAAPYITVDEEGQARLCLYAVWDSYPSVEAEPMEFTLEEAQGGNITCEALLKNLRVTDDDPNCRIIVLDYRKEDFTSLNHPGRISVRYLAEDQNQNMVSVMTEVIITKKDSAPIKNYYPRFISRKFFLKEDGTPILPEEGGLAEDSPWLTLENYRYLLTEATREKIAPVQVWKFSPKDRGKLKERLKNQNYQWGTMEYHLEFLKLFASCRLE